jgi:protein-disulfide isomerase
VEVSYDRKRLRGNPAAPVVIVEFSDFQCPFCRRVVPTLRGLLDKYKGQVSLAYLDFPLREIHDQAELAAEASRCAGEQGKFWEFHDLLFGQSSSLARDALVADAQSLGLDRERFGTCLESGKYKAAVEEDFQAGQRAGASGTPAFFINGVPLEGARPAADFEKIIDAELKKRK